MAEDRRSAIGNERVGARLGRLFQRNRTQEERDILEAYRTQTPVDEIRRRRGAAGAGAAASTASMAGPDEIRQAESRAASPMMEVSAPDEVAAALSRSRAQRAQRRPDTRMSLRAAQREMSADELNALSMARGEGSDSEAAANIRRRLGEMDAGMKKGGAVKKMAKGGAVKMAAGGASKRADGCAMRGKTKGRMV